MTLNNRIPPLNALHAFVVTARHLNFTRAAAELFVTQGAVSRQIASLEAWLGFALFQRHARGLRLTPQGSQLLPEVREVFDQLFRVTNRVREGRSIRMKAPTCAMRWLVAHLMTLEQRRPDIHVSLTTTTEHGVDFRHEDFDVAVVFAPDAAPRQHDGKLFDEVLSPVLAPHLLPAGQAALSPEQLARLTLLHPTHDQRDWKLWLKTHGIGEQVMRRNQQFDTMDLAISAAIQGFGVAMADVTLVAEDIRRQRLVMPFAETVKTGAAYYLAHRPGLDGHAQAEWLTDFLASFTDCLPPGQD
ncbi:MULTISPECIES: LysR substrate-binding domain-containing protein [Dickeya]|uniref:LysR substrate-binding domain-containing protein n=1 Tax=Dickeya TaxID=204037 RepID=UPI00039DC942|nr:MULTISPECIES: LysR substrate-binding domain-containing protein [Dickeya]AYH48777.1 LysR family transcriptional regulator [Dickeya fangzhongdai]MBO8132386.1 LysR family transcriptional regulator [Dickeya fangzhongdai]UGA49690.1 LysR substrate-binding domain-containing protein [Dickeya fangzhongdai]ULR29757.1 LysR substrate-binding domain-containing protein [Dickeya fangzhongdai]UWH06043.1 LysR family transcriptional regulator [Dickeya fangzhongdai]